MATNKTPPYPPNVLQAGMNGLRFVAKKQGTSLFVGEAEALVDGVLVHVLQTGHYLTVEQYRKALGESKRKADLNMRRACAAEVTLDHLRCRIQAALDRLAAQDEVLAARLAVDIAPHRDHVAPAITSSGPHPETTGAP